jgi:hypothetical protein
MVLGLEKRQRTHLNGKPTSEDTFAFAGDVLDDHDVCLCKE